MDILKLRGIKVFCISVLSLLVLILSPGCKEQVTIVDQTAKLIFVLNEVQVNNKPAKLGQIIPTDALITTGKESYAEIRMGAQAGIQVRENSKVQISLGQKGWDVVSHKGAALSLVRKGSKYRLRSPAAVMAVRGTIFYVNTYNDSTQYICTCNGTVDINHDNVTSKSVSASHHEGYSVVKTETGHVLEPTAMKEHDDLQIFEFMYRLDQSD
jgi:hypothetical protein